MAPKKEENLSKEKLLAEIERLKKELKKRKKYGLVWEEKPEEVVEMCKKKLPATPRDLAFRCKEVTEEAGLQRVRLGNLHLL
ncbi:MAG: hypothetical protein ABSG71_09155 [Thermodesulfobacteriota bacterium]|jgi:hypothetical protein